MSHLGLRGSLSASSWPAPASAPESTAAITTTTTTTTTTTRTMTMTMTATTVAENVRRTLQQVGESQDHGPRETELDIPSTVLFFLFGLLWIVLICQLASAYRKQQRQENEQRIQREQRERSAAAELVQRISTHRRNALIKTFQTKHLNLIVSEKHIQQSRFPTQSTGSLTCTEHDTGDDTGLDDDDDNSNHNNNRRLNRHQDTITDIRVDTGTGDLDADADADEEGLCQVQQQQQQQQQQSVNQSRPTDSRNNLNDMQSSPVLATPDRIALAAAAAAPATSGPDITVSDQTIDNHSQPFTTIDTTMNLSQGCAICMETEYTVGDQVVVSPNAKCCHVFHRECILEYLIQQSLKHDQSTGRLAEVVLVESAPCPVCRRDWLRFKPNKKKRERTASSSTAATVATERPTEQNSDADAYPSSTDDTDSDDNIATAPFSTDREAPVASSDNEERDASRNSDESNQTTDSSAEEDTDDDGIALSGTASAC